MIHLIQRYNKFIVQKMKMSFQMASRRSAYALLMAAALSLIMPMAHALTPQQQADMLATHNQWRHAEGVPPLKGSDALSNSAQQWADQLKETKACKMQHSGIKGLGENLYWASPRRWSDGHRELQPVTATHVTNAWGNEKKDYDYAGNTCTPGKMCGHYTQVVWRTTTEVGCARAVCADQSQVWVCQYTPPGNRRGQKPF